MAEVALELDAAFEKLEKAIEVELDATERHLRVRARQWLEKMREVVREGENGRWHFVLGLKTVLRCCCACNTMQALA